MSSSLPGMAQDALGIDTNAGTDELKQALAAIQAVRPPTAAELTLPELQKYVQMGVLSPSQYQAMLADPQIYSKVVQATQDNSGMSAQKAALQQLGGIVQAGGSTPINQANLVNNINQTNQAMKGARGAITQDAQQRGVSGGGLEFMTKLADEQGNAEIANQNAVNNSASNARLALDALTQQGQVGGTMQGQANQSAQAQAEAARQIAEYNSQLQSQANQYNTQAANEAQAANLNAKQSVADQNVTNANQRTAYNAQVPQTIFSDNMSKAGAMANVYSDQSKLAQKHAQQDAAFTGGVLGTAADFLKPGQGQAAAVGGSQGASAYGFDPNAAGYQRNKNVANPYYGPGYAHGGEVHGKCYAQGGEVHDHDLCMKAGGEVPGEAQVEGDSSENDTVPATLSPGEVVIPRSVATAPDAPQKAAQFMGQVKGQSAPIQPTVNSFAEALKILEENGLELRLQTKG